uniref:Uncharacterized protein n=1 Tax=Oryza sativa subsp. japonica TaxID=39947 RepID=Q67UG8_ORYSJ|nr:hypothetical protein [Oryza sativa Japonica Group]
MDQYINQNWSEMKPAIVVSAVLVQVECKAPIDKCLTEASQAINKALEALMDKRLTEASQANNKALDVVVVAAPPAKKSEIEHAMWKQRMFAFAALGMAEGDEKKLATASLAYKNVANAVLTAAPAEKFKVMEESFKVAARQATVKSFEFFLNISME